MERIKELFTHLAEAGLTVDLGTCEFARATVTYFGCVVGLCQVWPVGAKVQAVEKFTVLICFLALVSYYHSFCTNFSIAVAPLADLLKGEANFTCSPACQRTFEQVKPLLGTAPVLAALRFDRPFQTLHEWQSWVQAS